MVAAGKGAPECPVFYPTIQEVNSMTFVEYVEKLEKQKGFREAGVCKIVAPDGWAPRRTGYNRLNFELPRWATVRPACGRELRCLGQHAGHGASADMSGGCRCPVPGPSGSTLRGGRACTAR